MELEEEFKDPGEEERELVEDDKEEGEESARLADLTSCGRPINKKE